MISKENKLNIDTRPVTKELLKEYGIILFISTVMGRNSGNGGHYRSLLSYYEQLKNVSGDVSIAHYNEMDSSVLDDKAENLLSGIKGTNDFIKKANRLLSKNKTDVVISFGESLQSRMLRYFCWKHGAKFIQVIAGGPNRFLPMNFINCIYYSSENMNNPRDFTPNKFLLTNRIDTFPVNHKLIAQLEKAYPKKGYNLLRVSRICEAYVETFVATINLHKLCKQKGVDIQTHLIGHIQDENAFNTIKEKIEGLQDIHLITDKKFTDETKKLMEYYNVAVGIGRGFGEAASKRLLVFGYSSICEYPIIINEENYEQLRSANFSPRSRVDGRFGVHNHLNIFEMAPKLQENNRAFTYSKFVGDYNASQLPSKLSNILESSKEEKLTSILLSLFFITFSEIGHRTDYFFQRLGFSLDIKRRLFIK